MILLFCFNLGDLVVTSSEDVDLDVFGLPFVVVCGFAFLGDLALRFTLCGDFGLRLLDFFMDGFFRLFSLRGTICLLTTF